MDTEDGGGEILPDRGDGSVVQTDQVSEDENSMSGSVRGRRVTDPTPVLRAPPGGEQYDPELTSAWQSMGKVKSALRRTEHRLDEMERYNNLLPVTECVTSGHSSAAVASVTMDRLPAYRIHDHLEDRPALVDNHGRTNYMRSRTSNVAARKVSRLDDKYLDDVPTREGASGNKFGNGYHTARSPKKVEFKTDYNDIESRNRVSYLYDKNPTTSSYRSHVAPSLYDISNSSYNTDLNTTDPRAIHDTEIRFLNDNHGGNNAGRSHEGLRRSAGMSRLTQVKVTVPGTTLFGSSYVGSTSIYTTSGRTNTSSTTSLFSRPDYRSRSHAMSAQNITPSFTVPLSAPALATSSSSLSSTSTALTSSVSSLTSSATAAPPASIGNTYHLNQNFDHTDYKKPAYNGHTSSTRSTNNPPITTTANTSSDSVNTTSSGFATVRKLRKSFNDSDGLNKLKEKIKQQRMNLSAKTEEQAETSGCHEAMTRKTPHHDENVIVPKTYPEYAEDKPLPTPKVRKVAAGPPPPSYKGFSEPESKIRPAEGKVFKLTELMRRKTRRKEASERQDNKNKEDPYGVNTPEDDNTKKLSRVVAKKPSKYDKKDIITTRSWRVGQEAILRELGPARVKKIVHSPPTKDYIYDENDKTDSDVEVENKPPPIAVTSTTGSASGQQVAPQGRVQQREDQHEANKSLSAEAKSVLADLMSDNSDSEEEAAYEKKTATKRKILKSSEPEKPQPAAKIRHYDSDEVRRFIAKQRADRKRKLLEEKESQRKANENRQKQLQELYKRQKEMARVPIHAGQPPVLEHPVAAGTTEMSKTNLDSTFTRQDDTQSQTGAEKFAAEYSIEKDDSKQWSDASSDTSTLTGDSFNQPTDTDARAAEKKSNKKSRLDLLDMPLDVEDIISKYAKAAAARQASDHEGALTSQQASHRTVDRTDTGGLNSVTNCGPGDFGRIGSSGANAVSSLPPADLSLRSRPYTAPGPTGAGVSGSGSRTRAERIAAITNTAASLRNRLRIETERITQKRDNPQKPRGSSATAEDDRWAFRRPYLDQQGSDSGLDFVPRHERLGGAKEDYTVFKSNLPGVSNLGERLADTEEQKKQEAAATTIQAMYRGHTVRQGLEWASPPLARHRSENKQDKQQSKPALVKDGEESEGLSDITLTEDSDMESTDTPKVGSRLRDNDFHGERRREPDELESTPQGHMGFVTTRSKFTWNEPAGDPYSVINIYTRQYERDRGNLGRGSELLSGGPTSSTPGQDKDSDQQKSTDTSSPKHDIYIKDLSHSESPILSVSYKEDRTNASATAPTYEDDFTGSSVQTSQKNVESKVMSDKPLRVEELKAKEQEFKSEDDLSNDDDTLEGSYGYSLESDEDRKKHQLVLSTQKSQESLADSDLSSLGDDISRRDPMISNSRVSAMASLPPPGRGYSVHTGPRLSPAALSQRMTAELNLLEGMEESVRQLTDTDRTRSVALAQQETVSLAQILKSRQQEHERSMQALQIKARQESLDASKQLETARRRAADAAQNAVDLIAQVRAEGTGSLQESTKKLISSQNEVARATAQAAKQLAQVAGVKQYESHSTQVSQRSDNTRGNSRASKTEASYDSESFDSSSYTPPPSQVKGRTRGDVKTDSVRSSVDHSKRSAITLKTASVATASDASRRGRVTHDSDSSIKTDPEAAAGDASRTESIPDEISSSVDDYSLTFEATEDELEEQSFREILPSLGHMKKVKKEGSLSDLSAYSSDHEYVPTTHGQSGHPSRSKLDELASPFHGKDDTFTRFTADMVKQYMKEEEIRAQHQAALLHLREKALKEKTKAELAWLEQQKRHLRDKGADDSYPAIRKKKRGVLMRLQQEQMEIKRLQEAHKAEIKRLQEAHMKEHLDRRKELTYLTQSTQQVQKKAKLSKIPCETAAAEHANEDALSMHMSDIGDDLNRTNKTPSKDNKSDSEIYTENSDRGRTPSPSGEKMTKLQKMKLDKKYLTLRERKLRERRKNVEELLAWKKQLDEEEEKVYSMEAQALQVWDSDAKIDNATPKTTATKTTAEKKPKRLEKVFRTEKVASKTSQDTPRDISESIHTDTIVTARDESKTYQSIPEEISSQSKSTVRNQTSQHERSGSESSLNDEIKTESRLVSGKDYQRSGSESSIPEQSRSSSAASQVDKNRTHDSSDDTIVNSSVNEEYTNDTFESAEATATTTDNKKASSSSPPKANKLSKSLGPGLSPRSLRAPKSPFSPANNKRGSESESEDSFSLTHSETASDQSDNEGRIRALTEELRRRKIEAERLKKEQKRRQKERMKAKEASLKKQIEAYEILIQQVKTELQKELEHEPVKPGVKPQIKHPRVSESKRLRQEDKPRTESESSKSSLSSADDSKDMTGSPPSGVNSSNQQSPQSPSREESLRQSLSPVKSDSVTSTNKRTSLESISESAESPLSSPSKSDSREVKSPSVSPDRQRKAGASSPHKADSNISISEVIEESIVEELPDESSISISEPAVKSARSLTFKLDETSKVPERENRDAPLSARSDRHEELSAAEVSEAGDYSYSSFGASQTDERRTPRAESVNISKTKDVSFRDSDAVDDDKSKSKIADQQEKLPLSACSAKSVTSEIITEDFESASESEAVSRSRKSDKLTRSYSREGDYTEDFSESSVSHSEKTLSRRSDREASIDESIHTDEEISEALSVRSDTGDKHVELTFDLHAKLPGHEAPDAATTAEKSLTNLVSTQNKDSSPSKTTTRPVVLSGFSIGDRVLVGGVQPCTLRFVGETSFAPGIWAGVELDVPEGRNDGSKDGIRYFKCKPNYGLFAPPEKISRLSKDYKKTDTVNEALGADEGSDASEHTLTDQDASQMSDILNDLLDIPPTKSAKPDVVSVFPQQVVSKLAGQKEEDEEEVSVASDNSLMNAVSSAAAAVEEFNKQSGTTDSLTSKPAVSPKRKNLNAIVDNITDGLTHMVIKDTMKTVGQLSERKNERRVNSDITRSPEKADITRSPERRDTRSRVSDETVDRVDVRLTNGDDSHLLDMLGNKHEQSAPTSTIKSPPPKSDNAATSITQNLLDDAISHMLSVRRRQRDKAYNQRSQQNDHITSSSELSSMSTPPASPTTDQQLPIHTPVTPDDGRILINQHDNEELTDDMFEKRVVLEPSKQDGDVQPPRPVSPVPGESNKDFFNNEQFSTLNLMETDDIFADQEWLDDDFWTNRDGQAFNDLKISAADGGNSSINNSQSELKLDLQKLTQELFYAVPHKREEVQKLVHSTVDFYWQRRRYGESWENLTPPAEYFTLEDKGHDLESNSRRVYKRLVFDLTGEILRAIYQDEEEVEIPPWAKKKFKSNKYFKEKIPPTTPEQLKQVAEGHVMNIMGLDGSNKTDNAVNKFRNRKKHDPVDDILVQELREEEPEWVDYDDDELAVKMQLADSIFDSLVVETASLCNDIYRKRAARNEASTEV